MEPAASAHKTIPEKRNRKMKIAKSQLQQIIIEEYLREEGIQLEALDPDKFEEFKAWVNKTGPKPDWLDDYGKSKKHVPNAPSVPDNALSALETMPMDIPSDDATERDVGSFQDRSGPSDGPLADPRDMSDEDLVDAISNMIQGRDPERVAELFQVVFSNLPDVEMSSPEDEIPGTEYVPGAMGRPTAGFKLEELKGLIREVLAEGHYHDMGAEDEMYDALDPHGFNKMSDAQIVDQAWKDGIEEMIALDGEGTIANREEVIAALQDV
jgi:hypothetical protein